MFWLFQWTTFANQRKCFHSTSLLLLNRHVVSFLWDRKITRKPTQAWSLKPRLFWLVRQKNEKKSKHNMKKKLIMVVSSVAFTPYLSVFSPNAGKYGPQKLRMRTIFTLHKHIKKVKWRYKLKKIFFHGED